MCFIKDKNLKLVLPDIKYKKSFLKFAKISISLCEKIPWFVKCGLYDFEGVIKILNDNSKNINVKKFDVPSSTYFCTLGKKIVGTINIKHQLSDKIINYGGIGYYVAKRYRKKGVATKMLNLGLIEAKKLNLKILLICCDKNNIASKKIILKNNFKFEDEIYDESKNLTIERYLIEL